MICYTCGKFIKKGHGENVYWYRGKYRYYCPFCLRKNAVSEKIKSRRSGRLFWVFILALPLLIIGSILLWKLKFKPELARLDKEDWEPILKEEARIRKLENFIYSFKKGKEFCHCWKCLMVESEKKKETKFRREWKI